MSTTTNNHNPVSSEVSILSRVLGNKGGTIPREVARYILNLGFSDHEKSRVHELTVRNQGDGLDQAEQEELYAYVKAGSILSILKSKARRTLKVKPRKQTRP